MLQINLLNDLAFTKKIHTGAAIDFIIQEKKNNIYKLETAQNR
jgi:hypothetical protein